MSAQMEKTWCDVQTERITEEVTRQVTRQVTQDLTEQITEKLAKEFAERQLRDYRENLRGLLQKRFSTLPPELIQRIETAEVESLRRALLQVVTIDSPEQLTL